MSQTHTHQAKHRMKTARAARTPDQIESTVAAFRDWLEQGDTSRLEYLGSNGHWQRSAIPGFDLGYVYRLDPGLIHPSRLTHPQP